MLREGEVAHHRARHLIGVGGEVCRIEVVGCTSALQLESLFLAQGSGVLQGGICVPVAVNVLRCPLGYARVALVLTCVGNGAIRSSISCAERDIAVRAVVLIGVIPIDAMR